MASATRQAIATGASQLPSSAVKTPAGTWLVLHGALLGADGVAVFIQRAHPTLVAPLLLKAYGLTAREQEVAQWLLRGAHERAGRPATGDLTPHRQRTRQGDLREDGCTDTRRAVGDRLLRRAPAPHPAPRGSRR
jgi:hypothetical protein